MTKMRRFYTNELFHEFLFFSLALICMLIFAFIQPFGEGPDEINRFRVVRFIYENGRLPKGDDPAVLIPGYGGSYAFQPMLTYILDGYLLRAVRVFTERFDVLLVTARLINVAFGMAAAFFTRRLSRLLFPEKMTQWLFSCLVVFLPQSIFLHTYINTDSCALFSVILMFAAVLEGMKNGFTRSTCIQTAVGVILCALSYYNAYGAVSCYRGFIYQLLYQQGIRPDHHLRRNRFSRRQLPSGMEAFAAGGPVYHRCFPRGSRLVVYPQCNSLSWRFSRHGGQKSLRGGLLHS